MIIPEDKQTNTVSGAAAYERMRSKPDPLDCNDGENDEPIDGYDDCNCSDPGCPCDGWKVGTP